MSMKLREAGFSYLKSLLISCIQYSIFSPRVSSDLGGRMHGNYSNYLKFDTQAQRFNYPQGLRRLWYPHRFLYPLQTPQTFSGKPQNLICTLWSRKSLVIVLLKSHQKLTKPLVKSCSNFPCVMLAWAGYAHAQRQGSKAALAIWQQSCCRACGSLKWEGDTAKVFWLGPTWSGYQQCTVRPTSSFRQLSLI